MPPAKRERNAEIVRSYARGRTQASLAEEHGISCTAISDIIQRHRVAQGPIDRGEAIRSSVDLLDHLIEEAAALVQREGAPVTAGKDGLVVVDPELKGPNGEPVYVRDYSGRIAAMALIKSLQERKAKLLGLDSATKHEVSGEVKYQISGLQPDQLT